mgnify:CR=1 FL=1
MVSIKIILDYLSNYKSLSYLVLAISIIAAFLESLGLSLLIPITNEILLGDQPIQNKYIPSFTTYFNIKGSYYVLPLILIFIFFLKLILVGANIYLTSFLGWSLRHHYASLLMSKYLNSEFKVVAKNQVGDLINSVLNETTRASQGIRYFTDFITKTILLISLMLLLLISSFYFTLILFASFIILALLLRKLISNFASEIGKKRVYLSKQHTEDSSQIIGSIKESKVLGLNDILISKFNISVQSYSKINVIFNFFSSIPTHLAEFILVVAFGIVVMYIGYSSADINNSLPIFTLFFIVSARIFQTASAMINVRIKYLSYIESINKVSDNVKTDYVQERNSGRKINEIKRNIEFKNVNFHYEKGFEILENINLKIEMKKFVGIVGSSGSGKSTFINLITSLLSPTKGNIYIDDENLNNINISSLRKKISYVSQNPYLFNDTIFNNIKYGNMDANKNEIIDACKAAECFEFIQNLPLKFETIVGDRGSLLSGGQLQRIAIARAILRKPSLFIFDESTSSLDNLTEESIIRTIGSLAEKYSIIFISHKKEILKHTDLVFEIKDKKIREIKLDQLN